MKLLIVGSDEVYSIENFYVKYLREAGVTVELYTAQKYFYQYYQKNILNKLIYRAGVSGILQRINKGLLELIERFQPEVLWVFKGMEVLPGTLRRAKEKGIRLVNYNGDSPFIFSSRGSGNKLVTASIPLYDLHLSYSKPIVQRLKDTYGQKAALLPFGYDVSPEDLLAAQAEKEVMRICFLGNPDKNRAVILQKLADKNLPIDLYGNHWAKFVKGPAVQCFKPVYGLAAWKVLRRYRVQLNMMRPHNPDTHNMRSFELGGIGAIQLAADTPDHRAYFTPGQDIFLWRDVEQCIEQARYLLTLQADGAEKIRNAARQRSLDAGYDYRSRALHALRTIEEQFA